MPILIKDYDWEETETLVNIKVPLKGVSPAKVDIINTDDYIKINYPPYLFEAFLYAAIYDDKSKAEIGNGIINFVLRKIESGVWGQLQHESHEDKTFMKQRREKAIEYKHEKAQREQKQKDAEKDRRQKFAVREQMRLDEIERKELEDAKETEKRQAMEELEQWKNQEEQRKNQETARKEADEKKRNEAKKQDEIRRKYYMSSNKDNSIFAECDTKKKDVPPPRSTGTIQCKFTNRVFPTPSRESKAPEEEAWLEKVAAMNKMKTDAKDAVDMEEMNPIWLKDKGCNFYKLGNFIAAINAFTAAIVLDGSIPSLYSNRAACHLHMKQYHECIQDCTSALERLTPPVPANAQSRCKALVRRGTASFQIEDFVSALQDYETALKIDANNEKLRQDADKIRNIIQGTEEAKLE